MGVIICEICLGDNKFIYEERHVERQEKFEEVGGRQTDLRSSLATEKHQTG